MLDDKNFYGPALNNHSEPKKIASHCKWLALFFSVYPIVCAGARVALCLFQGGVDSFTNYAFSWCLTGSRTGFAPIPCNFFPVVEKAALIKSSVLKSVSFHPYTVFSNLYSIGFSWRLLFYTSCFPTITFIVIWKVCAFVRHASLFLCPSS